MLKKRSFIKSSILWLTVSLILAAVSYSPIRAYMKTGAPGGGSRIMSVSGGAEFLSRAMEAATSAFEPFFFQVPGIAPTGDAGQGFEIEGDLNANTPTADTTDWVAGVAGAGAGVLTVGGAPVDPLRTFRAVDAWDSNADDVFSGGLKYTDNPNTWTWTTKKATAKDDLNNGLLHVSNDVNNHLWLTVGSDRFSTNGNSYIDFEFLQSPLTANADGSFTSAGPDGGRTVGDLLLTLELTMGGGQPNFYVQRWQLISPGVFSYVTVTPAANTAFAASNSSGAVPVPFGAFGSATYAMNAFAEGSIDVTALIAGLDPCILVRTVLVKSKASQEATAALKDFIAPIQLNLGTSPAADAGQDLIECQANPGPNVFTVNGTAINGAPSWSVIGSTGTASATIISPSSATTNVNLTGIGTVTLRLSVSDPTCGIATDEVLLEVTPNAIADAGADQTACRDLAAGSTVFTIDGIVTMGSTVTWSVLNTTGTAVPTVISPSSPSTDVNVTGTGTVTLRITADDGACGIASDTVILTVNPSPTATAGAGQTKCQNPGGPTVFSLAGSVTNGTPSWSVIGSTGTASATILSPSSASTDVSITGSGTVTLALVSTSAMTCGTATSEVVLTVNPLPAANAGADKILTCAVTSVQLDGSSSTPGATFNWSGPNGFASTSPMPMVTAPGVYTLTATNPATGCVSTDTVTVTQNTTAPNASAGPDMTLTCSVTQVTLNGSSTTPGVTFGWTGPNGYVTNDQNPTVTMPGTYVLTTTIPETGCTMTDSVVISRNDTVPNATAGQDKTLNCAITQVTLDGASTTPGVTYSWSGPGGFVSNSATPAVSAPGTYTLTITDPASGCSAVDTVVVSQNTAPPNVSAGPDKVLTCSVTSVVLNGSSTTPGATFSWSGPGGFASNSATPAVGAPGTYTLTVTDPAGGCTAADSVVVTQNATTPNVSAGIDQAFTCSVNSVILNGSSTTPGATFSWSGPNGFASNSATPTVSAPGTYTLTVTDPASGCTASDIVLVTQDSSQVDATITAPSSVCAGSAGNTASVPSAGPGATYQWSIVNGVVTGGQGTRNLTWSADSAGPVTLNVTVSATGCSRSGTKQIVVTPLPNTQIMAPVSVCESSPGNSASVPNAGAGANYQWSIVNGTITGGQGTPNIMWTAGTSGSVTINVTVTAGSGCAAGGSIAVPATPQPTADAGPDQSIPACTTNVQLAGSIGGGAAGAVWSGGEGSFMPNANALNAIYVPTPAELAAGSVTLTLSTDDPGTACGPASDEVVITFLACADLSLKKSLNIVSPNPGDNVIFTLTLTNSGPGSATKVSVLDLLPAGLTYVTAVASQGTYNVYNGIWSLGTLGSGKTATLKITVTFSAGAENAVNCAEVFASDAHDPDSTPNNRSTAEDDYDCAPFQTSKGPGLAFPADTEGGDANAGSILIFPVYSSNSISPNLQNTRISLTNTSQSTDIAVKLLFVDGASCSVSDSFMCLTRNQTSSFIISDFDPDITGYIIAIAIDCETGCPINFNCLIGDAYVKFASGHRGNIGAEAYNSLVDNPAGCDDSSGTATLKFDGRHYTQLPRTLIADSLPSRADGNDTLLVIDRIGGNMMTGANGVGSLFGLLFNDVEVGVSFSVDQTACQLRAGLNNNFPRTVPRYESHIPTGRSGWMKIFSRDENPGGIIGVSINFNPNADAVSNAFNGAHNLHHQTLTSEAQMIIPVFPPNCC